MLYEHKEVDMIFMDISMPVMNGYDAAINIRKDSTYADLPIVALTANILPSDIQKSIDSGMQEHIGKPFNVTAFYDAIIKYLSTTPIDEFDSSEPEVQKTVEVKENESKSETVEKTIHRVESEDDTLDVDILDRERGLDLVGNDKELLQELLEEFILMYKDSVSKLDALIESRDYSSGQKLSHDIKGVSANLGLMQVHERVKALEMTFKAEDSEDGKRELEKYANALKIAIQEIQS
jgi:CheY-like chemotaxis protein